MRKAGLRFRYFGCGEYGEKLNRPHGHICLFGIDFMADSIPWRRKKHVTYYRSEILEKYWKLGNIEWCLLAPGAAGYTAGYTFKKIGGKLADEINPDTGLRHYEKLNPDTGEVIELMPEFTMASTKPAIGKEWLEKNYREIYPADTVVMNGKEYPVPRKYDEWLKKIDLKMYDQVMAKRYEYVASQPFKTPEELSYEARARDTKRHADVRPFK
jgi:hypothetical protein